MSAKNQSAKRRSNKKKARSFLQKAIRVVYALWVTLKTIAVLDEAVRDA